MSIKLLMAHRFEFLRLKGGCNGSSESTLVKMKYCWKSHVVLRLNHILIDNQINDIAFNLLYVTYQGQQMAPRVELH